MAKFGDLERVVWEIRNESLAPFLDGSDQLFNFANVFADSSCVDIHHFDVALYFIEFLVHHHNFDNESCAGIKPDYFSDTAIQLPSCLRWQLFDSHQCSLRDRVVKKAIPLTNMMSAMSTTNLCNQ